MVKGNNNSECEVWDFHGGYSLMSPSSGLRGLSEDGTIIDEYEYNSDVRQYCIGDFEDGDLRIKLDQSRFYITVRQFCQSWHVVPVLHYSCLVQILLSTCFFDVPSSVPREDSIRPIQSSSISTNFRIKLPILFFPCLPSRFVSTNSIVQLQEIKKHYIQDSNWKLFFISNSYEINSIKRKRRW